MKLKDKVAVITGASSGIGEAAAKLFAEEGAVVALVARTPDSLQRVADEVHASGGEAQVVSLDVCNTEDVNKTFATIEDEFGKIDILLNCAGVFYPTPGGEMLEQDWRNMLDINLGGTINTCNAVLPGMKSRGDGRVVNIASVSAIMAVSGYSIYCASKAAVIMLTKALAAEFATHGIHINAIAPGNTATPLNENIRTEPEMAEFLDAMKAVTPSQRIYSNPEDIARSALFLASQDSLPFYGSVLVADEGISLGM